MTTWRTVPVEPTDDMRAAFAVAVRIEAEQFPPGSTAHERLAPLWAAILSVAPQPAEFRSAPVSSGSGYARGVADVLALARQAADRLEATTARPLSVGFAVEALRALADEAQAALLGRERPRA